jgi:hypothetical protein
MASLKLSRRCVSRFFRRQPPWWFDYDHDDQYLALIAILGDISGSFAT